MKNPKLSRRDALKLLTLAPASLAARPLASLLNGQPDASTPHVLIFVFDAWSAANLKWQGYHRDTMPNLERFARRAYVYHNHYSTASFTVPGTASLLTGLYPWTHRAVQLTAGGVVAAHRDHNLFAALSASHKRFGYAQNPYADIFLYQFRDELDSYIPEQEFNLLDNQLSSSPLFKNDAQIAFASFENNIVRNGKGTSGSLYLGMLYRLNALLKYASVRKNFIKQYPAGLPIASGVFLLDDLVDGMINAIKGFDAPTAAYFHVFPPHEPYAPKRQFASLFDDGWNPPDKPLHPLATARLPQDELDLNRRRYDQYLAAWDAEFARVLDYLQTSGLLEKSIVILTSDHGELFERGQIGHNTYLLSSPVVKVPLMISLPGQTQRKDIDAFTSSIDLLPTIANLVGTQTPSWAEGSLLPGLGGEEDLERGVYSIDAKTASSFSAFKQYSISLIKQRHRLVHYQYSNHSGFEFYNMDEDPEEVNDLFPSNPALAMKMKEEMLQKIDEINRPFQK